MKKILIAGVPAYTQNYRAALSACQIPYDVDLSPLDLSPYSGLLLPGGGDILPERFGQPDLCTLSANPELDRAQFALLDLFVQKNLPVLGICRGMQIINVYFGGDLIQDLPTKALHLCPDGDCRHPVSSVPASRLFELCGASFTVNSAHHQGCGRIGKNLTVTQRSPDGVAEALEHKEKPILGVQWHPERMGFPLQNLFTFL